VGRWPPSSTVRSTDLRRLLGAVLALAVASGCAPTVSPEPSASPASSTSGQTAAESEIPTTAAASPSRTSAVAVDPGHPYDGSAILAAMRSSQRPGGVPDQLETEAIAAEVAERVWTFTGDPWAVMSIGGSCGPSTCTLEVGGTPAVAVGEDLYVMEVTPASGSVEVVEASLRGLTQDVVDRIDRAARAAWRGNELEGLVLASAGWSAPPDEAAFELSYRSGGEEGSPGMDVIFDVESGIAASR
jgi:hypothetical protein